MRIFARDKQEQNLAAVDPWTLVHFSAGLALGLIDFPVRWALSASLVYEAAEQVFERKRWGQRFFKISRAESLPNAILDSTLFLVGHRLGTRWNQTGRPEAGESAREPGSGGVPRA